MSFGKAARITMGVAANNSVARLAMIKCDYCGEKAASEAVRYVGRSVFMYRCEGHPMVSDKPVEEVYKLVESRYGTEWVKQ